MDFARPSHRYVPGQNARHPEDYFDNWKMGAFGQMSPTEIEGSMAWQVGVALRREGYFWECHEVLEAIWLALPDGPMRSYVQAVIQMANAQLKVAMDRPKAAHRLCGIVLGHLEACRMHVVILGCPVDALRREATALAVRLEGEGGVR